MTLHSARAAQQQRLPVSGKIRPGIKVLTAKVAAMPGATKVYDEGMSIGASFDDIEKTLKAKIKNCPESPLIPRNAPYFRVSDDDFATPGAAAAIMKRYAAADGFLYEFPIIFPSDDIDLIFRRSFEAWRASELSFWSEVNPSTGELDCMRRQAIKPTQGPNRRKYFWGGRPIERVGPCDPNTCEIFGIGHCKHHCTLYFYVPGCPGVGVIELDFTSAYAYAGIMEILTFVKTGLGHIKGTHNSQPIFWISQLKEDVSRVDYDKGKAERSEQWIIKIEAPGLDMAEVFALQETGAVLSLPAPPQRMLLATPVAPEIPVAPLTTPIDPIKALRKQVNDLVKTLGLKMSEFVTRQATDFGPDWSTTAASLEAVLQRMEHAKETGEFSALVPVPVEVAHVSSESLTPATAEDVSKQGVASAEEPKTNDLPATPASVEALTPAAMEAVPEQSVVAPGPTDTSGTALTKKSGKTA